MKILFLDDEEWRHEMLQEHLKGSEHDVTHVYSAEDALKALDAHVFDLVSLDHDLGTGKTEGRAVSKYLMTISHTRPSGVLPKIVVIHSWNVPASRYMLDDLLNGELQDVVLAPFRTFNYKDVGCGEIPSL